MTNTTAPALGDQVRIVSDYSTTAGLADRVGVVVEVDERTAGVQYPGVRWVQHAPHAEIVVAAPAPAAVTIPARDLVVGDTLLAEHDGGTERGRVQAVEQRREGAVRVSVAGGLPAVYGLDEPVRVRRAAPFCEAAAEWDHDWRTDDADRTACAECGCEAGR